MPPREPQTTGLADIIPPRARVLFVGYNPGRHSAAAGHHFAGPANHFWTLLHQAGFTDRLLRPEEDGLLPTYRLGVTNLVARMTPGSADLSWQELLEGGERLRAKVARYQPRILCLLGKDIYRAYTRLPRSRKVAWGFQPESQVPGTREFVMPNPSPRSTIPFTERLRLFRLLREAAQAGDKGR